MNMGKGMKIPMMYLVADGVEDCKTINLNDKDADGNVCKQELPVFIT